MISNESLEQEILKNPEVTFVKVDGDGYHYQLTIVSNTFIGKSTLARQQWVYGKLKNYITSGNVHALSMKTWTTEEWEKICG